MDGDATLPFFTVVANATAAPIRHVVQTSIARGHAVTRVGTGTSVTAASPAARQVSTAEAAAAQMQAHARAAPISRTTRPIRARALST